MCFRCCFHPSLLLFPSQVGCYYIVMAFCKVKGELSFLTWSCYLADKFYKHSSLDLQTFKSFHNKSYVSHSPLKRSWKCKFGCETNKFSWPRIAGTYTTHPCLSQNMKAERDVFRFFFGGGGSRIILAPSQERPRFEDLLLKWISAVFKTLSYQRFWRKGEWKEDFCMRYFLDGSIGAEKIQPFP